MHPPSASHGRSRGRGSRLLARWGVSPVGKTPAQGQFIWPEQSNPGGPRKRGTRFRGGHGGAEAAKADNNECFHMSTSFAVGRGNLDRLPSSAPCGGTFPRGKAFFGGSPDHDIELGVFDVQSVLPAHEEGNGEGQHSHPPGVHEQDQEGLGHPGQRGGDPRRKPHGP